MKLHVMRWGLALLMMVPLTGHAYLTGLGAPNPASITVGTDTSFDVEVFVTLSALGWGSTEIFVDGQSYLCLEQPSPGQGQGWSGSEVITVPVQGVLATPGTYTISAEDYEDLSCQTTGSGNEYSQPLEVLAAPPPFANVTVTKTFSDDIDDEVEVTLTCNGGDDLIQSFSISQDSPVIFNVHNFTEGVTDCEVTENLDSGMYIPEYDNGDTVSEISCAFDDIISEQYTCDITNNAAPAELTVNKTWDLPDDEPGLISPPYVLQLRCIYVHIEGGFNQPITSVISWEEYSTDDKEFEVELTPTSDESFCVLVEYTQNNQVEAQSDCALFNPTSLPVPPDLDKLPKGYFRVMPGGEYECDIGNTLFFEGIPSLNQYGMALLALLMLGLAYLGMRRIM